LVLENLKEAAKQIKLPTKDGVGRTNIRDAQMAKNLNWLAKTKFPNQKIIVWAANAHIMKNTPDAFKDKTKPNKWMGTVFTENSSNMEETYVLGFNSKKGNSKWASEKKAKSVNISHKNGFETWIDDIYKYAFIDFKAFRKENPNYSEYFIMKALGHNNITAVYTNVFDGIFYIRDMEPCIESKYNHLARQK
jgi:erythromycin esterase